LHNEGEYLKSLWCCAAQLHQVEVHELIWSLHLDAMDSSSLIHCSALLRKLDLVSLLCAFPPLLSARSGKELNLSSVPPTQFPFTLREQRSLRMDERPPATPVVAKKTPLFIGQSLSRLFLAVFEAVSEFTGRQNLRPSKYGFKPPHL
jgi:hypothetical protein